MPSSLHATMESLRHDVILHQDALPHHRDHVKHQVHDVLFVPPKYQISNMPTLLFVRQKVSNFHNAKSPFVVFNTALIAHEQMLHLLNSPFNIISDVQR